ncbi:YdcF family protein [Actinacidiphila reveromycinica]|nr:YdcF family protein [Streptomyces sp. SN-593]
MHHVPRPCSVVIALGSHDLTVADTAADLYARGMAPLVVMTGATSPTSAARMPRGEAVHYRERALDRGVPDSAVLLEPEARNTGENITKSRELLAANGVEVASILLVSKPYEERRAYATLRKVWPSVDAVCASVRLSYDDYVSAIGDEDMVIAMMVGATQRIMIYPARGLTVEQPVPTQVRAAYARLRDHGFTGRLARDETE